MAKRFGRTVIGAHAAGEWRLKQAFAGSDHADLAGDCERPVIRSLTGMPDKTLAQQRWAKAELASCPWQDYAPGHGWFMRPEIDVAAFNRPTHVDIAVRCRKCPTCLRARAAHWRLRARAEYAQAERTWFGTLTLSPEAQFKATSLARSYLAGQGLDFDRLPASEQFGERHKAISPVLTRYLKRVRKLSGAPLRYIIVAEAHKSGLPHYHALIHETGGEPVRHRVLSNAWQDGFSNWKLVHDEAAASYVTKYLSKSALARVRASQKYGSTSGQIVPDEFATRRSARRSPF